MPLNWIKKGIPYILESKDSLINHEAVKPLYFLLGYLTYNDYLELIKFLRSDLVGLDNQGLKYLLRNRDRVEKFMRGRGVKLSNALLQKALSEIRRLKALNYRELTNTLIQKSGLMDLFGDNSGALKNIYHFFKLMRQFSCLKDFMDYIEENKNSDELKQVGVKEENAVKLMTIHKSKGLSFETEFFYWCPGKRKGGRSNRMEIYVRFDDNFEELEDYLLTHSRYTRYFEYLGFNF